MAITWRHRNPASLVRGQVFAPSDEAFEALRLSLSGFGQQPFTRQQVLELPEMLDIMKYHIVGGAYTSGAAPSGGKLAS